MGRSHLYYKDFEAKNSWRFRLVGTPAGDSASPLIPANIPAWRAAPGPGSNFVEIDGPVVFTPPDSEEEGTDEVPIGLPSLPTLKLKFNLAPLSATTNLQFLRSIFIDPGYPAGGVIEGRTFTTSTVWTLYCDYGDPEIAVDTFTPRFMGVHDRSMSDRFESIPSENKILFEVELSDIALVCMREVTPADVRARLIDSGDYDSKYVYWAYTDLWRNAGGTETYFHAQSGGGLQAVRHRFNDLWDAIAGCLEQVFRSYTRRPSASVSINSASSGIGSTGTPYDTYRLKKRSYLATGAPGAVLPTSNRWIISQVMYVTEPDVEVDGYLWDGGEKSTGLFAFERIIDYIDESVLGGVGKCQVLLFGDQSFTLYMGRVKETFGAAPVVSRQDLRGPSRVFEVGASIQTGASCSPAALVDDISPIPYKQGSEGSPDLALSAPLHNLPDLREPSKKTGWLYGDDHGPEGITGRTVGITNIGFRTNCIYYEDTPAGITDQELLILPSSEVDFNDGDGWITRGLSYARPTPNLNFGHIGLMPAQVTQIFNEVGAPYIELALLEQLNGCIPYVAARSAYLLFSSPVQTLYEAVVSSEVLTRRDLMKRCDVTAWPNGNIVLPVGQTWLGGVPGSPIVMRLAENYDVGTTTVKFFALGS